MAINKGSSPLMALVRSARVATWVGEAKEISSLVIAQPEIGPNYSRTHHQRQRPQPICVQEISSFHLTVVSPTLPPLCEMIGMKRLISAPPFCARFGAKLSFQINLFTMVPHGKKDYHRSRAAMADGKETGRRKEK